MICKYQNMKFDNIRVPQLLRSPGRIFTTMQEMCFNAKRFSKAEKVIIFKVNKIVISNLFCNLFHAYKVFIPLFFFVHIVWSPLVLDIVILLYLNTYKMRRKQDVWWIRKKIKSKITDWQQYMWLLNNILLQIAYETSYRNVSGVCV